jgi:hypothetical protein
MFEFARTKLDIVAPASDLLYKNAYEILMNGVTDGFVVGKAVIEGVRCDHLAFRAPHVDLQHHARPGQRAAVRGDGGQVEPEAGIRRADLLLHATGRREEGRLPFALNPRRPPWREPRS